jgi:general secretion pathway protein N
MKPDRLGLALWSAFIWYQGAYAQEQAPDPLSALPWLKLEQLSATRERPLFTPGRRRAEPPRIAEIPVAPVTIDEGAKPPEIELTGLLEEADVTIVFLRTSSQTVILRSGDKFGRWLVVADSKTSVKLTDGAEQMRLNMFKEP